MNKNALRGLTILLLWAAAISLAVLSFSGGRPNIGERLFRTLPYMGFALLGGFYLLLFAISKGRRLRLALMLAAGIVLGLFLNMLSVPSGLRLLILFGILALYILACSYRNYRRLREALQPLNEAALAYQKDRDGEKCLAALDRCAALHPNASSLKRPDTGVVTYQEHIICEKIHVLGDMGRLEERSELIRQLQQETKSSDLLKWLEEKAAEFTDDAHRKDSV